MIDYVLLHYLLLVAGMESLCYDLYYGDVQMIECGIVEWMKIDILRCFGLLERIKSN